MGHELEHAGAWISLVVEVLRSDAPLGKRRRRALAENLEIAWKLANPPVNPPADARGGAR